MKEEDHDDDHIDDHDDPVKCHDHHDDDTIYIR